jgi:hypothetical protein
MTYLFIRTDEAVKLAQQPLGDLVLAGFRQRFQGFLPFSRGIQRVTDPRKIPARCLKLANRHELEDVAFSELPLSSHASDWR